MDHREPPWRSKVDAKDLRDSERRHGWMCAQLETRRRFQMNLSGQSNNVRKGDAAMDWYRSHLSGLFPGVNIVEAIEVLSDGIGFVEPIWSAFSANRQDSNGVAKFEGEFLAAKKKEVKEARDRMARNFDSFTNARKITTQRSLGRDLYEPGLFLVTEKAVYFCQASDSGRSASDRRSLPPWLPMVHDSNSADLPLRVPIDKPSTFSKETNQIVENSLLDLTLKVLWPCLLPRVPHSQCFSLVLIHTSLWQETAGVWALHVASGQDLAPPSLVVPISNFRPLVEPAIMCLEDVLGWSCEFEGTHRWKRYNVDFLYEILGKERPNWTLDGIDYGSACIDLRELDKIAYELSVDRLPSDSIRNVFRQAVEQYNMERNNDSCPQFDKLKPEEQVIIHAVDGAVVGIRLDDLMLQLANEIGTTPKAIGVSNLPSTASMYLSYVEHSLDLPDAAGVPALQRGQKIHAKLSQLVQYPSAGIDKQYCALIIECFKNYLDKFADRQNVGAPPSGAPRDRRR